MMSILYVNQCNVEVKSKLMLMTVASSSLRTSLKMPIGDPPGGIVVPAEFPGNIIEAPAEGRPPGRGSHDAVDGKQASTSVLLS